MKIFDRRFSLPRNLWFEFKPWRGKQFRTRHRVAGFLGLTGSGKTVLMTSLINQLKDFDSESLPIAHRKKKLDRPVTITEVEGALRPRLCSHKFEYDSYRDAFKRSQWPEKTQQLQEYRARYVRDDRPHSLFDVSMLDIPGERLGDITMIGADFGEWSDNILKMLRLEPYRQVSGEFLHLAEEAARSPDKVNGKYGERYVEVYKQLLARLVVDFKNTTVSPSAFFIDSEDRFIPEDKRGMSVEELISWMVGNRFSGLNAESEFAPLPPAARGSRSGLSEKFARHYGKYVRKIALPVYKALRKCDSLVVLVDFADLLQYGEGMINAQDKLLEQLIKCLKPGTVTPAVMDSAMPGPRIHRIVFTASKADRIHQRDYGRLQALLKQICGPHVKGRVATTNLKVSYEVCSAVYSTKAEDINVESDDRHLLFKDENGDTYRLQTSALPEEIPHTIKPKDFVFPETVPVLPGVNRKPPEHMGLEKIVDVII